MSLSDVILREKGMRTRQNNGKCAGTVVRELGSSLDFTSDSLRDPGNINNILCSMREVKDPTVIFHVL